MNNLKNFTKHPESPVSSIDWDVRLSTPEFSRNTKSHIFPAGEREILQETISNISDENRKLEDRVKELMKENEENSKRQDILISELSTTHQEDKKSHAKVIKQKDKEIKLVNSLIDASLDKFRGKLNNQLDILKESCDTYLNSSLANVERALNIDEMTYCSSMHAHRDFIRRIGERLSDLLENN